MVDLLGFLIDFDHFWLILTFYWKSQLNPDLNPIWVKIQDQVDLFAKAYSFK